MGRESEAGKVERRVRGRKSGKESVRQEEWEGECEAGRVGRRV